MWFTSKPYKPENIKKIILINSTGLEIVITKD